MSEAPRELPRYKCHKETHTYATLEVSGAAYDEIANKLKAADYGHAFMDDGAIDMHGIGITRGSAQASAAVTMTEDAVLELARKIAAVPGPENFKGGAVQRQARIQVILNEAFGIFGKTPMPSSGTPQDRALQALRAIAEARGGNNGETIDRTVVRMLTVMWADAVRAEWRAFVDADPQLKAQHAVALELMREDGYTMDDEPVCSLPGAKPMVAIVDGKEAICFDRSIMQVTPLSAIYTSKVRVVQSAAARVAKALTEEAVKQPPEWPITTANGETFNSIEEMERSPTDAVREIAKAMRKGARYGGVRQ